MPATIPARIAALAAALALAGCGIAGRTADRLSAGLADTLDARAPGQTRAVDPGLGIVGTVTGAAADGVAVNGLEVATRPETVLRGGFAAGPLERARIPPGHVVEVAAEREAGRLVAREIEPIFALAGPVQAVAPEGRRLLIMGTEVLVPAEAVLPQGGFASFRPGQPVAVSGLWRGDEVVASRIDFQTPKTGAREIVSGVVTPMPGARYRIGGVPLAAEWGTLRPGFFHVVSGEWASGALLVDEVRFGRSVVGRWPVEALVVEGFGRARDFAGFYSGYPGPDRDGYFGGYTQVGREGVLGEDPAWRDYFVAVGGLGRPVEERDSEVSVVENVRALFAGDYEGGFDGEFDIEHVIPLPEAMGPRREVLAALGDPIAPANGALYID